MIPEKILKDLVKDTYPEGRTGGQQVTMCFTGVTLTHDPTNFKISIGGHRSMFKNHQLALTIFELYLKELKVI